MTNVRGEYLGPGCYSISPQQNSTFWLKNNKNISAISKKSKQKDAGMYFIKRTGTW